MRQAIASREHGAPLLAVRVPTYFVPERVALLLDAPEIARAPGLRFAHRADRLAQACRDVVGSGEHLRKRVLEMTEALAAHLRADVAGDTAVANELVALIEDRLAAELEITSARGLRAESM